MRGWGLRRIARIAGIDEFIAQPRDVALQRVDLAPLRGNNVVQFGDEPVLVCEMRLQGFKACGVVGRPIGHRCIHHGRTA